MAAALADGRRRVVLGVTERPGDVAAAEDMMVTRC